MSMMRGGGCRSQPVKKIDFLELLLFDSFSVKFNEDSFSIKQMGF